MNTPARLHKKTTTNEKIDEWALNHAHIILPLAILALLILFAMLCYAIVGVSAVESGVQYNHLADVI